MTRTKWLAFGVGAALALGAAAAVFGLAQDSQPPASHGVPSPLPGEAKRPALPEIPPAQMDAAIEATRVALEPQDEYLALFNSGERDWRELPIGEIPAFFRAASPLDALAKESPVIALVVADSITFHRFEHEDLPVFRVTYTIERVLKGNLRAGETLESSTLGGPYLQPDGSEFFILPTGLNIDAPGQRLLLLGEVGDDGWFVVTDVGGRFELAEGRVAASAYNSQSSPREGMTEASLLAEVEAALR